MSMADFAEQLRPLAKLLSGIDISDSDSARNAIEAMIPFSGDLVTSIRSTGEAAAEAGWLLPKESGAIRFGRVAKDLEGFSVDAVLMSSPGPKHRHPNGEIDLCFTLDGEARFDGRPEGWVVYGPDTTHIPTVTMGTMLILYFLPGGAMEFL